MKEYLRNIILLLGLGFSIYRLIPTIRVGSTMFQTTSYGYEKVFGGEYVFIDALTRYTPEKAVILHPPQSEDWPVIGNQPVIRFFLFPRTLVSGALLKDQISLRNLSEAYFVEILDSSKHWPVINTDNKTIIFDTKNEIRYNELFLIYASEKFKVYRIKFYPN